MKLLLGILGISLSVLANANQPASASKDTLAAEQGDAYSQTRLGQSYENGDGVAQDFKQARKWYELAARQGRLEAQLLLAILYEEGPKVDGDYQEAVKWYRLAADQGSSEAQRRLALLYRSGNAGDFPDEEIRKYMLRSVEQGNMTAVADVGMFFLYDVDADNMIAADRAAALFKRAADKGDAAGQMRLGRAYSLGIGVPKDARLAQHWLSLSAAQGNANAKFFLKKIYGIDAEPLSGQLPPPAE